MLWKCPMLCSYLKIGHDFIDEILGMGGSLFFMNPINIAEVSLTPAKYQNENKYKILFIIGSLVEVTPSYLPACAMYKISRHLNNRAWIHNLTYASETLLVIPHSTPIHPQLDHHRHEYKRRYWASVNPAGYTSCCL